MHFAKTKSHSPYNIATSGVMDCTLADLRLTMDDLALHGPNSYGYLPLTEKLGARFGIGAECVVEAGGASFANHLAMAALVAPGDEVLIEDPTYELMVATLRYLQADLKLLPRRLEDNWALDVAAVKAAITPKTRLVVLTNLHNPSGEFTDDATLHAIAQACAEVGAVLLVDEVYRELMFRDEVAKTAFSPDGNIVITSSLTKAYGLSGLRAGWILAPAALAERMRRLNDLFAVLPPHVSERMSAVALDRLPELRRRAYGLIETNRAAYVELLGAHPALEQTISEHGTTVFPRLKQGDGDALFARLTTEYETSIVPGRYFGMPQHFRVGLAGDVAMTRVGLERLAEALLKPL
jgi:hypothetical protein